MKNLLPSPVWCEDYGFKNRRDTEYAEEEGKERLLNKKWDKSNWSNLIVLVRNLNQLKAALKTEINIIYCEFEDPKKYREAVELVRSNTQYPMPHALKSSSLLQELLNLQKIGFYNK